MNPILKEALTRMYAAYDDDDEHAIAENQALIATLAPRLAPVNHIVMQAAISTVVVEVVSLMATALVHDDEASAGNLAMSIAMLAAMHSGVEKREEMRSLMARTNGEVHA